MTFHAKRSHNKRIFFGVSGMVMILLRGLSALRTRKAACAGKPAVRDSVADGVSRPVSFWIFRALREHVFSPVPFCVIFGALPQLILVLISVSLLIFRDGLRVPLVPFDLSLLACLLVIAVVGFGGRDSLLVISGNVISANDTVAFFTARSDSALLSVVFHEKRGFQKQSTGATFFTHNRAITYDDANAI